MSGVPSGGSLAESDAAGAAHWRILWMVTAFCTSGPDESNDVFDPPHFHIVSQRQHKGIIALSGNSAQIDRRRKRAANIVRGLPLALVS